MHVKPQAQQAPSIPAAERSPRRRRWTRKEYDRIAKLGLFEGQRVELIGGEILIVSPQSDPHIAAISLGFNALQAAFGPGHWVRCQGTLDLGRRSQPDPDLAVVVGSPHGV